MVVQKDRQERPRLGDPSSGGLFDDPILPHTRRFGTSAGRRGPSRPRPKHVSCQNMLFLGGFVLIRPRRRCVALKTQDRTSAGPAQYHRNTREVPVQHQSRISAFLEQYQFCICVVPVQS